MNKKTAGIIAIVIITLGLVIWSRATNKTQPVSAPAQPFKIGLSTWIGDGLFYVADARGFFKQENVDVKLINTNDTGVAKQLLSSGQISAYYLTPETVVTLADAGVPVKIFAANDRSNGADGVVANASIKTISDLKNKTVAFEVGSPSHFLLGYLLKNAGLATKDLTVVNQLASDAGAAFIAGKVPAAVTWEPYLTRAKEVAGGHVLSSSKDVPVIYDMLIFRGDVAAARPEDVKKLLRATFAAREWIYTHPDEAAQIMAKAFNISPAEATEQMQGVYWPSYQDNLNFITTGEYSVKNAIAKANEIWLSEGIIKNLVNVDSIVDDSVLKNLYK